MRVYYIEDVVCLYGQGVVWIQPVVVQAVVFFGPKYNKYNPERSINTTDLNNNARTKNKMVEHYKSVLVRFMSFRNDEEYDKNYEFTQEELGAATPIDVKRYMCHRAYGMTDPGAADFPIHARSSSLAFWKKAISHFMPNKLMAWNALAGVGNPTKSIEVNELIKAIKKMEVRKQGKTSTARRAITHFEFLRMLSFLKADGQDDMRRYGLPGLFVLQYNLIARIDDTCQFLISNLTESDDFDFVLRSKLNWSKNVNEERDAPNQILLGAMDHHYCALLALAVHLEIFLGAAGHAGLTPYVFGFSEDITVPIGGKKTTDKVQTILKDEIFQHEEFHDGVGGLLGSHSNRKLASTQAWKNGCSKDEKDLRGRWKRGQRVSDVYDDIDLPFPDAKVAGRLCIGGPCKYALKEGTGVTDNFLVLHVVPMIRTRFSLGVALVLGKALLWLLFSDAGRDYLPPAYRVRVLAAYNTISQLAPGENPVLKIPIVVSGHDGELYLDELGQDFDLDGAGGGGGGGGVPVAAPHRRRAVNEREQLLALQSQMSRLNRNLDRMRAMQVQETVERRREFQTMNSNLRCVALQPIARRARANNQQAAGGAAAEPNEAAFASTLSPSPRNLFILWDEFENGIGGRKAACLFTCQERGAVKHKYHHRKVIWDCIASLV